MAPARLLGPLGIDTDQFTAGQLIYLGLNGAITGSAPLAPLHNVRYKRYYTLGGVETLLDATTDKAFDGFGYFEDHCL